MNEFAQAKEVISVKNICIISLFTAFILYVFIVCKIERPNFNLRTCIIKASIFAIAFIIALFTFKYPYIHIYNYYRGIDATLIQEIAHKLTIINISTP